MKATEKSNNQNKTDSKQLLPEAVCRPILFSTAMVKAIQAGRKSVTRRIFKVGKEIVNHPKETVSFDYEIQEAVYNSIGSQSWYKCPYGTVGDIIWVRETFAEANCLSKGGSKFSHYVYKADNDPLHNHFKWKPSLFMPKDACRLFLEITEIRVERLQEISENDAVLEGVRTDSDIRYSCYLCDGIGHIGAKYMCEDGFFDNAFESFRSLWISIIGQESWDDNPFVWVISFKRVERPLGF